MPENNNQAKWSAAPWHGKVLVDGDGDGDTIGMLQDVNVDVETAPPGQFGAALGSAAAFDSVRTPGHRYGRRPAGGQRGRGPGPFAGLRLRQRPAPHRRGQVRGRQEVAFRRRQWGGRPRNVRPDLPVGAGHQGDA